MGLERVVLVERRTAEARAAQQADRSEDHFLAVLSHELRTPLPAVLLAIGSLEVCFLKVLTSGLEVAQALDAESLDEAMRRVADEARVGRPVEAMSGHSGR